MSSLRRRHAFDKLKFSNNSFLAQPKAHDFLQDVWLTRASKDFMAKYAHTYTIDCLVDYKSLRKDAIKMNDLLVKFIHLSSSMNSNIHMGLDVGEEYSMLSFEFPEGKSLGKRIMEQIWLLICLDLFKKYSGCRWSPSELHVPGYALDGIRALLPHGPYPIKYEQTEYRVIFKNETTFGQKEKNTSYSYGKGYGESIEDDLLNIQNILMSYKPGYRPKLEDIAIQFKVSARSIKRILESRDTTFRELSGNCLLRRALVKLSKKSMSIEEISDSLGYSDSPNFIRSFKSWTGMTPAVYRDSSSKTGQEPVISSIRYA